MHKTVITHRASGNKMQKIFIVRNKISTKNKQQTGHGLIRTKKICWLLFVIYFLFFLSLYFSEQFTLSIFIFDTVHLSSLTFVVVIIIILFFSSFLYLNTQICCCCLFAPHKNATMNSSMNFSDDTKIEQNCTFGLEICYRSYFFFLILFLHTKYI